MARLFSRLYSGLGYTFLGLFALAMFGEATQKPYLNVFPAIVALFASDKSEDDKSDDDRSDEEDARVKPRVNPPKLPPVRRPKIRL